MQKIPVGVSQCLMGDPVRFDGGHKRDACVTEHLSKVFDYRPHCPEMAIGLGVPRKPIRLVMFDEQNSRVLGSVDATLDVTQALDDQARHVIATQDDLCGYILMKNSPSCGLHRVKRYAINGDVKDTKGRGRFADALIQQKPWLPMEESGRLNNPNLLENFVARVFALHDWKSQVAADPSAQSLLQFYARYKYQIMAHHLPSYKAIGQQLSNLKGKNIKACAHEFFTLFMAALAHAPTRKTNTNTLAHLQGYLKKTITREAKKELGDLIEAYRLAQVPLVVPLTLLKHHLLTLDLPYLKDQTYWSPFPEFLGLRNYV